MPAKDWDAIARALSEGEDSDEHDSLNVAMVRKRCHRVAELVGTVVAPDAFRGVAPPMGMNRTDALRAGISAAAERASQTQAQAAARAAAQK